MANVRVSIEGLQQFTKSQLSIVKLLSQKQVESIAKESAKTMQFHVLASIKRKGSTGNLAESIFAEKTLIGWGVGKISFLNNEVPYWRWINFGRAGTGRTIPPSTLENPNIVGHFDSFSGGRFQKGDPRFPIFPKVPISPHNFIQRTLNAQNNIISSVLKRIKI